MIKVVKNPKKGSGFDLLHSFEGWKVAFITYAEQYDELKILKRHTQTDEAFVLVKGEATLYATDEDFKFTTMRLEKEKLYIVENNTWHHLKVSKDATLIVVENSNTTKENTESRVLDREEIKEILK